MHLIPTKNIGINFNKIKGMSRIVYLDNNATTPVHPEVKKAYLEALDLYGNPSSMHQRGQSALRALQDAREKVASFIGADKDEIIFTGSGSEADNSVISSVFCNASTTGKNHIITSSIEHPAVYETAKAYQKKGLEVTFIPVDGYGQVDPVEVQKAIKPNTALISIMYANNEIGTLQPVREIATIAHEHDVYFHTDAVQATGRLPLNVNDLQADYITMSAHKIYGPKGIGILYIRNKTKFCPFVYGGHHENGRRAGTENTPGIIATGKAFEMLKKEMDDEQVRMLNLKQMLKHGLLKQIPDISFNGHPEESLPNTLNVTFDYIEGESILLHADFEGIALSTGSACSTGSLEPSHVIMALGLKPENAHGSVRFSLGRENTEEDVAYVLEKLPPIIERLRKMSPLYVQR